jgi:hypothetical protein
MNTNTDSALHMMEGQGLSDAQIVAIAAKAYAEGRMSWLGFEKDEDDIYSIPVLSGAHFQLVRAVLEAVAPKTALSHFADEVEASGEAEKHAAGKSLNAQVADLLRPFLKPGQKVIWREPFRWFDDNGVMSNHYDGMSIAALAEAFGYLYDWELAFEHAAIVWKQEQP